MIYVCLTMKLTSIFITLLCLHSDQKIMSKPAKNRELRIADRKSMSNNDEQMRNFAPELSFQATRSSGAGGQNVNKVNTRVELRLNIGASKILCEEEKETLREKLAKRITKDDELIVVSQSERTQFDNRRKAEERLNALIDKALKPLIERKPTRPTKASKEKRLTEKKVTAERKARRKYMDPD